MYMAAGSNLMWSPLILIFISVDFFGGWDGDYFVLKRLFTVVWFHWYHAT